MRSLFLRTMMAMTMILGLAIQAAAADAQKAKSARKPLPPIGAPTSSTLPRLGLQDMSTTEALEAKLKLQAEAAKAPTPEEAAKLTTDSLVALFRTGRPALGVGWFQSYDSATSTVTIRMDPKLTAFPHAIEVKSRRWNIPADRLYERERNGERKFKIDARTYVQDDSLPLERKPGQKERPTKNIPITSFKPGEKVSITYRIVPDSKVTPKALNVSKVDPNRTYFTPDFDPLRGRVVSTRRTTGTTIVRNDVLTSASRMRQRMHRPPKMN